MPLLQKDVLPGFDAAKLQIAVIHCFAESAQAATHVQLFGLTYPMLLDFDTEMFRRLRLKDHVYPLNVVIDQDGKVAHVGDVLDDAVATVKKLLN